MDIKAAHTRLFVSDIAACVTFYRDVMQFTPVTIQIDKGYAEFEIANMHISLFRQQEMSEILRTSDLPNPDKCQDKVGLILHVQDLEGIYSQLRRANVEFAEPPTKNSEFSLKVAYCRDPEGHLIGFFESVM